MELIKYVPKTLLPSLKAGCTSCHLQKLPRQHPMDDTPLSPPAMQVVDDQARPTNHFIRHETFYYMGNHLVDPVVLRVWFSLFCRQLAIHHF